MREVNIKRKDGGFDRIAALTIEEFPYINIPAATRHAKHKKWSYLNCFGTFDIETTTIHPDPELPPEGFMYHWQMDIGGVIVYGRRWEEWLELMKVISEWIELSEEKRMVIYIHNAGYEFQFIKNFLIEEFGGCVVFATGRRQPVYIFTEYGFEFRCSMKLTNMSLHKATINEYGVLHPKAKGDLDYYKIRTADTPLDDTEFGYCISDVVSLYELIENRLINEGDTLDSIPLTSTGYVRRECRAECRKDRHYRDRVFKKQQMSKDVYILLKEAGRGGNTHTNRYMSGQIFEGVDSFDEVSGYPAMMLLKKYPMSKFSYYGKVETETEFDRLLTENACLFRIILTKVKVRSSVLMPYIPESKLTYKAAGGRYDNGRLLQCDYICMTVTDIDWNIIKKQYTYDEISISDFYIAKYDYLPEPLRNKVKEYFRVKCELKFQIETCKNETEKENLQYLYNKQKNRLNGIFGMAYTSPVRPEITINDRGEWIEGVLDIDVALEKFYKSRNSFLVYAWGVWTTALNRAHLERLIELTGKHTIYCDTDSSKAIITPGILKRIEAENRKIEAECEKMGAFCDVGGKRYYVGTYEHETEKPYKNFCSLGAKKYAYTDDKGFHITIAGVEKKTGAKEMKSIDNFKPGFIFRKAGGRTLYYNEAPKHYITVDGCTMLTASNVGMIDSTYELGITDEYAEVIGWNVYKELT